jgi:hypothetical protein
MYADVLGRAPFGATQFLEGAEMLAHSLHPGESPLPAARRLADAMRDGLAEVRGVSCDSPDARIHMAVAAALMAYVRPEAAADAEAAIGEWLGAGLASPRSMTDARALISRVLLAIPRDEVADAVACVDTLAERFPDFPCFGGIEDLVVACVQGHGHERERACLEHVAFFCQDDPTLQAMVHVCDAALRPVERRHATPHPPWPAPTRWPLLH